MNLTSLQELRDRIAKASGAERALDGDIAFALGLPQAFFDAFKTDIDGYPFAGFAAVDGPDCFPVDEPTWAGGGRSWEPPAFTASVDAALALMQTCLPDANCYGIEFDPRGWEAHVSRNNVKSGHWMELGYGKTAPLAILDALLKRLAALAELKP